VARESAGSQAEQPQILDAVSTPADRQVVELSLDVRYYGQTPYMNLRIDAVPAETAALEQPASRYRDEYERELGSRLPVDMAAIEVVNARVAAIGIADKADLRPAE